MKGISEIFGEASDKKGGSLVVYRALRPLLCSSCGAPIAPDELFTRQTVPGFSLRIMPRCRECVPFELRKGVGEELRGGVEEKRSKLMDKLLSPSVDGQKKPEGSAKAHEEAARRLGPALSRSRRKTR